jgi:hypothetical protein
VFSGLGKLPGVYSIDMTSDVKAVQDNPRRVLIPMQAELKKKITEMKKNNSINTM